MAESRAVNRYRVQYLDHTILAVLPAGQRCTAWIKVLNDSDETWLSDPPDGHAIDLAMWIDGQAVCTSSLPGGKLKPGQAVKIPVIFSAPAQAGTLIIKVDMVHQNLAFFEDQGIDPLLLEAATGATCAKTSSRFARPLPRYAVEYVDHRVPVAVAPGARFGVWVHLKNRGSLTWETNGTRARYVNVVALINDQVIANAPLPQSVMPGGTCDVHLAVPAPIRSGRYLLKLGLVHENVACFHLRGVEPLMVPFEVRQGVLSRGVELYEAAVRHNSWFYQPSGGVAFSQEGAGYPLMIERAQGCHIWDTEGRQYIDYTMGWGCALLGHAHEPVQQAVRESLHCGGVLPLPHPVEIDVTRMLCRDIPCAEMIAFGKNGSDVCTLAVRLARIATGRRVILTCGYHGWQDWFAESFGFAGTGVPARPEHLTFRFAFNDLAALRQMMEAHRADLAAVMLEPSGPSGATPQGPGEDVDGAYLRQLADETRRAGALLIFDEIITGFRYPGGCVQKATGVVPDLACFGKALGNGWPIAVLCGRRDVFQFMPQAFYGPTFKGEIYSLAAARAALDIYRTEPVAEHIWRFGQQLKDGIDRICTSLGLHARMIGPPFRCGLQFHETDPQRLALLRTLFVQELLKNGLITYHGVMLPSYAHDQAVLDRTLAVVERALRRVEQSNRAGTLHRDLEMPLISAGM
ncbi:MAG: aminotransferase class III-fold pyridoxal phosphate-dependent enzyme [Acidobacteriota bacterium]|jgi:glutamate-1-semialdehyde aminotransferase